MLTISRVARLIAPNARAAIKNGSTKQLVAPIHITALRFDEEDPMRKVGPYPRTKEERERAARKYNLIPEDYEPIEEGYGQGDYPNLKAIGAYNRDWYDDFDDPVDLRFYNEPLQEHYDLYLWERIDPLEGEKGFLPPHWVRMSILVGMVVLMAGYYHGMKRYEIYVNHPWKNRVMFPDQIAYQFPPSVTDTAFIHHHDKH